MAIAIVLCPGGPALAKRPRPSPCPSARFLVERVVGPLVAGNDTAVDALATSAPVTLDGCGPATKSRIVAKRKATKVTAKWLRCGSRTNVRLVAKIAAPACELMAGKVVAKKTKKRKFSATRSLCGDARVDLVGGEACDGASCPSGAACAACACPTTSGSCTTVAVPLEASPHVATGSAVTWNHNPPASGRHYPVWARYTAYSSVVPRGYWVHNLEHGAIVLLHRPDADPATIAALRAAYESIPDEPTCQRRLAVLTPDPLLETPTAVVAWGFVMTCEPVDADAIRVFANAHQHQGPEQNCVDGTLPPSP